MLVLLAVLLAPLAVLTGAALVTAESLRRANRLTPGRSPTTSPPLRWLWSPSAAAQMHRRLRAACQLVGSLPQPPRKGWRRQRKQPPLDSIAALARDVLAEAVLVDRQIVAATYIARGTPRMQAMGALDYQVRAVEDAARRVHQLAARRAQVARPPAPEAPSLEQRIAIMEEAYGELTVRPPNA